MASDRQCEPGLQELVCLHTLIVDEDLIAELADRSEFVRTQLQCVGDAGSVQVPVWAGKLWVRCLLRTPAALRATGDATLVQFLKAGAFFQDAYMMRMLCGVLGDSLLDAANSGQAQCSSTERMTLVLEALTVDVAIDVLRSMPGSFLSTFSSLPQALKPVAALAEHPGLAAVCLLSTEGSGGADRDLPTLTLCVDTSANPQSVSSLTTDTTGASSDVSSKRDVCKAAMWLESIAVTQENEDSSCGLCVQQKVGTVGCCLATRERTLDDMQLELPSNACLVFGRGSEGMHLKDCTFKGGSVVCMDTGCSVTFENCQFEQCSVVVVSGAQATLKQPRFEAPLEEDQVGAIVNIFASGHSSRVDVQGGVMNWSVQGIAVSRGAHLEASGFEIYGAEGCGVEVKGEGTSAKLSDCRVIEAFSYGVELGGSEAVKLARCTVMQCGVGLAVHGTSTRVDASHCNILDCRWGGVCAMSGSRVKLEGCISSGNGGPPEEVFEGLELHSGGYEAREDAVVELSQCGSDADYCGCIATSGGKFVAKSVTVTKSAEAGFIAAMGGRAELKECSAAQCGRYAAHAIDEGSEMDAEGCTFTRSEMMGVAASENAVVTVRNCSTVESGVAGYMSAGDARMIVSNSSSMGDQVAFSQPGGALQLQQVSVDGVRKVCDDPPAEG